MTCIKMKSDTIWFTDYNVKENKERLSFRDKLRTRILRSDPRSCSDGLDRTPIAVDRPGAECETPVQVELIDLLYNW